MINQAAAGLRAALNLGSFDLLNSIEQSSNSLSRALKTSAVARSVGTLTGANDKLKSEMTIVLDRLSQTNSALQSIIGNAGLNLTAIESALNEAGEGIPDRAQHPCPRRSSRSIRRPPR